MQRDDFLPRTAAVDRALATERFVMVSMILNSALYLTAVFTAGLLTGHHTAWQLAIITMGICYITPTMQLLLPRSAWLHTTLFTASLATGTWAGLSLFAW